MADSRPLRLRRVRFKDGRVIEVIRGVDRPAEIRILLDRSVRAALASEIGDKMAGWAFIAWAETGEVFCNYKNGERSTILAGQVPQYAKDILLAEVAIRWGKEE